MVTGVIRYLSILVLYFLLISCNRDIYEYIEDNTIEKIELHDKDHFIYTIKNGKGKFVNKGSYKIESDKIIMRFLPIKRGLNYLPFNEGEFELEKIKVSDKYSINLSSVSYINDLGINFMFPMPRVNVIIHSEKDTIQITKTDEEGNLSINTKEEPKRIELFYEGQYKNVLLLNLEDFGEYTLFANVRSVYGNLGPDGCGGANNGPTKEMKIIFDGEEIIEIHDININLESKVFIRN